MTGHPEEHDEHEQHAPEEEQTSAGLGEGLERVRRELERGRAIARAREAAAEASRDSGAEGERDDADGGEAGLGDGTDGGVPHGAEHEGALPGGGQEPGAGQAAGAVRRSAAAERARQAVRRTGRGPGQGSESAARAAGEPARSDNDAAADTGQSAGASGGGEEHRSQGAERARQALKRAAPEARRAREEASRPQPRGTGQSAEASEEGAGETAVRRSAAAERARQAVARPGRRKARTEADRADAERAHASRAEADRTGTESDRTDAEETRTDDDAVNTGRAEEGHVVETPIAKSPEEASHPAASPAATGRAARRRTPRPATAAPEPQGESATPKDGHPQKRTEARAPTSTPTQQGPAPIGTALHGPRTTTAPADPTNPADAEAEAEAADETAIETAIETASRAASKIAGRARVFPSAAVSDRSDEFAETWWGRAWLDALESTALDAARLARGREYAGGGHVGRITVAPGRISAPVTGSRAYPYRAELRLRPFPDAVWEAFLDAVAARPAHLAALLGRTLPRALAERQDETGARLLPGPGDLVPRCSCPDRGHPCKHAAALCFQAARLLDADPFVLLLMRGRGERELLDELSRRNATHSAHTERAARATLPTVPARTALHARELPPLPPPLTVPEHPGRPPVLPSADDPAIDPAAVELLASDAAARARACLAAAQAAAGAAVQAAAGAAPKRPGALGEDVPPSPFPARTLWEDAIRLVAGAHPTSGLTASTREIYRGVAEATGRPVSDVARAVAAWRQGGAEGLSLLESTWDPPAGDFDRARSALSAADLPALRPRHNHLTDADRGIQLRFGRDGRWYPYESDPGVEDWWPTGRADADPVGALTPLLTTE